MTKFTQKLSKYQEKELEIEKEMGLQFPPNLDPEKDINEISIWKEYYYYLKKAYKSYLLDKELVPFFEEKLWVLKTEKEKREFVIAFSADLEERIEDFNETRDIYEKINFKEAVDRNKKTLPAILQPIFEYVAYTLSAGREIDPEVLKILESNFSEEELEAIENSDITQKIDEIRRNPLDLRKFNSALKPDQVAGYLDTYQNNSSLTYQQRIENIQNPIQQQPTNTQQAPQPVSRPQQARNYQQNPQQVQNPQMRNYQQPQNPQQMQRPRVNQAYPQNAPELNPKTRFLPKINSLPNKSAPQSVGRRIKGLGDLTK